ncbi:uncharacterized protein LOC124153910 [Ischnura elegans]|uniref:uncharacterized protein LOC124153910 n=1 Tax=Ischnura elegans TaxID=197161 RepID=UPI001ED87AE3|nr:uncharacterized protein LOC124153910 [Ischnura elegans]
MRVVALISGGKDSCYNMMQCTAAGHDIVALANLCPEDKDELDSYMYQTVGHHGINMFAEAVDLPLYRKVTHGLAVHQGSIYAPTLEDEVEDLYHLLKQVKDEIEVDAVAVGAILSDYQRVRVENVCNRLGLVVLSYLWRRDQTELLQEMIDCRMDAILIKVAALGLDPALHLGKTIGQMQPHLLIMKEKFGLNVCGEGGEYETFTLDCPLFKKSIVIDEWETVIHSDDAIAPVGYLSFKSFHLVDKEGTSDLPLNERLNGIPIKSSLDFLSDLDEPLQPSNGEDEDEENDDGAAEALIYSFSSTSNDIGCEQQEVNEATGESDASCDCDKKATSDDRIASLGIRTTSQILEYWRWSGPIPDSTCTLTNQAGWCWIGGILGQGEDCVEAIKSALCNLLSLLKRELLAPMDVVAVSLYIRDMEMFADINSVYGDFFCSHSEFENTEVDDETKSLPKSSYVPPPVRICVEVPLPLDTPILLDALAFREDCGQKSPSEESDSEDSETDDAVSACSAPGIIRQAMHVQGISHWAPANIGPYSQAVRIGDIIYVCGQIALIPGTMQMVEGGIKNQCKLALRHIGRIIKAIDSKTQLRDVVQGICYVTHPSHIPKARKEWEKRTNNAIVDYVVVTRLPRNAFVEWHIWAHRHNSTFDYEETGCRIHDVNVSIRRRWNYENTVAAIMCYFSAASFSASESEKVPPPEKDGEEVLEESGEDAESKAIGSNPLDEDNLVEALSYMLRKLLQGAPSPFTFVSNLRIFYKVGGALSPAQLHRIVTKCGHTSGYLVVHSLIPVCQLHNESTFLSICGVRHE